MKEYFSKFRVLKPTEYEWIIAFLSLLLTLGGILLIPKNFNVGIVTTAFFGLCFLTIAVTIGGKIRDSRFNSLSVSAVGGVNIRPSRFRLLLISFLLLFLGIVMVLFGDNYPLIIKFFSYIILIFGLILTLLTSINKFPIGYLRFEKDAFVLGRNWGEVLIPWDEIDEISIIDYYGNTAICLNTIAMENIIITPSTYKEKVAKEIHTNMNWIGAHIMIMTGSYGLSAPIFLEVLQRYKNNLSAREELSIKSKKN